MRERVVLILCGLLATGGVLVSEAAERHMMSPRVPADKLAEARALTSPLQDSPELVEKGKELYNGKGTCFTCHGMDGDGKGPAAAELDPSPRNFQQHGFWRHRTEGELFWVIKHGSPGTAMIGFGGLLSDEEIWTVLQYASSFGGIHRRGGMGPGKGRGPHRSGSMRGMDQPQEGDCCDR